MSGLLLNHLTREHAAIGEFLELLDREADAMTSGEFTSLSGISEHKSQLADQIAFFGRQRAMEQVALGYASDRSGTDAAAAAGGEELQTAWHDLLTYAAQARERNHRNGVMIHTHLDFTQQSIRYLQASGQPLYGPDGTHSTGAGNGTSLAVG